MATDIKKYGAAEGIAFYWVRIQDGISTGEMQAYLSLVAIDETGTVTPTGTRAADDPAAPTKGEAVMEHLSGAIESANAALERRRANMPEQDEPAPEPMDGATAAFFSDEEPEV